jgi:hypothetical protein
MIVDRAHVAQSDESLCRTVPPRTLIRMLPPLERGSTRRAVTASRKIGPVRRETPVKKPGTMQ